MRRLTVLLLGLAFLLPLLSCGQHEPGPAVTGGFTPAELDHPSFLWKVEKDDTVAWLFGTMHFAHPKVTTLPLEVEEAFAAADAIFTEIEETPSLGGHIAKLGAAPSGTTLADALPADLHARLGDYLASRGLPRSQLNGFRPWMATTTLGQLDAIPYNRYGVKLDVQLMHRAREQGKEFGTIETVDEQIASLTIGTEADHVHMLDVTLERLVQEQAEGVTSVERLFELYLSGDERALWDFAMSETDLDDPVQAAWLKSLLSDRNLRMASRVHARLREKPSSKVLFAFGALHFVGPEGVGEHLKSLGYSVTRVPHRPRTEAAQ